jgi:hypothetical protein
MNSLLIRRVLLWCSQALFLWMFFSTSVLERMADASVFQAPAAAGTRTIVYGYAAEWRHGLAGLWPVYVPGFFAVTVAAWAWSIGRPLKRLLPELLLLTGAAGACAFLLTPEGTRLALRDLHRELGIASAASGFNVSAQGVVLGIYSLLAWSAVVLACHRALWWRSLWPLLVPAAMDSLLFFIRPYTLDELVSTWLGRVSKGNLRAILCFAAVPGISAWLVAMHLRWEKRVGSAGKLPRLFQQI